MLDPAKARRLIYCPVCVKQGKINVLGEMTDDGIKIRRFHKTETIIRGEEFSVICGDCGEIICFKKKPCLSLIKYERVVWNTKKGY